MNVQMSIDPLQIVVSLMLFTSVFLLVWSVFRFPVDNETPIHRQIAAAMGRQRTNTVFEHSLLMPVMQLFLAIAQRMGFPAMRKWIAAKLDACGNPNSYSLDEFLAMCLASGVGLAGAQIVICGMMFQWFGPFVSCVMLILGFCIPLWTLNEEARARVSRISKKIPYTLDLIALMMQAGSTFTEAIDTLIRDEPDDDFNEELALVMAEIEFGTRRAEALTHMSDRIPLDTLRSIVGSINQAEAMGTPLSVILKTQSEMIRMHRSVRAEKLSAKASLRIQLPTMLILAAAVLALFGPLIVSWIVDGSPY